MAVKSPIRYYFNGSDIAEFTEFLSSDFIGIDDGGTGATTASGARTALGLQIGVDIQAYDAELAALSGLTPTDSNFIVGDGSTFVTESGLTVRNSLGLGTSDSVEFSTLQTANLTIGGPSLTLEGATNDSFETTLTVTDPTADRTITFPNATGTVALISDITAIDVDFAGDSGTGAVTDAQTFTIAGTSNEIETSASGQTLTIGLPNNVTIANNLTVTGNLDVNGTTTTIDSTNTTVTDTLIELANGTSGSPSNDAGIVIERGSADNAFIGFDESEDKFIIGTGSFTGASTGNLTISTGTLVASLEGNASTATALATGRTIGMTGDVVWTSASFDGSGNVTGTATIQANAVQIGNIDFLVDEDDMSSDSDVKVPTQQSVKAYVDTQLTAEDLDISADSGSNIAIDLDSEVLDLEGGTGIDTTTGTNKVTFAIDSTVATLTGSQTLTNKTIDVDNNTVSNIEVDNLKSGVLDTDLASVSGSDDTLASAKAIKTYVDAQIATEDTLAELNDTNITSPADGALLFYDNDNSVWIDNVVSGDITIADTGVATIAAGAVDNDMLAGSIANAKLANSTMTVGGVTLTLGATDATPAFDLTDATNYPTSSLTGTITNAQLAGSIANSKLANSSIAIGGVTFNLGDTDATPALDLTDATNYPTSSLTGTITNAQLAGSIANAKLANSSITVSDGSNSTATALGGTITFSGTSNEVEVAESSGTVTIGLPNNVTVGNNLTVTGNLTVSGTTTTVNTETVTIADNQILLNSDYSGNSPSANAGIEVNRGGGSAGNKTLVWDETNDKWTVGSETFVAATFEGNLSGNVTGNVSGSSGSTTGNAATATALETARTIAGQSFDGTGNITIASTDLSDTASIILTTNTKTLTNKSIDLTDNTLSGTFAEFNTAVSDATLVDLDDSQTLTNKTVNLENNKLIVEYAVTASGGNFLIDGEANATISFSPGIVYRFDLSHSSLSSHPFKLSTTSDGSHNSGSEYTTGKTDAGVSLGSSGAYFEYTVDASTPDILYYYCSSHSGMGGTITVFGSSYGDADVYSFLDEGTGITISSSGTIATTITQYTDSDAQAVSINNLVEDTSPQLGGNLDINSSNITGTGNIDTTGDITITSTNTGSTAGPIINLVRDSASPADADYLGQIKFKGEDDGGASTVYAKITGKIDDASAGTEDGLIEFATIKAGSSNIAARLKTTNFQLLNGTGLEVAGNTTLSGTLNSHTIPSGTGTFALLDSAEIITSQTALSGSVDTSNDLVLLYDNSNTALRKVDVSTLLASAGAGNMSSFTVTADSGSNQDVTDGQTLDIAGGTGISTVVGSTDTVTVNVDATVITGQTAETSIADDDLVIIYDTSASALRKMTKANFVSGLSSGVNAFKTISVSGEDDVVADSSTDTLTLAAGANITLSTNASSDTVTIAATGGAANAFSTLAVSGQSNVVADAATDTLTLVAGTGMTIATDASADSITFTSSSSGGGGTLPFTEFDGSTDNIVLSSAATGGSLPLTLADTSSDPIAMSATTQTLTSYADADDDTKIEVERSTDNDTVHVKAGGTDVITATSSGVTITNLTVTGTTTQANELKITDTLFELNADGGSLTTDAGMIVERGSTGANAAFIWDESSDSWVAGTTTTDGSAAANVSYTLGDLQAKTQNQSDNSTKVATTAYVDTATSGISSDTIKDADNDTKIEVENSDADEVVITTGGQERAKVDNNISMSARGGFFTHNLTMHASETYTIASTEGTVAAGPLDIQGTVDCQGTLVIV